MYRIKLTTGTVLEFDSLETLTVDIHAGVVDAEALIFHQRANQWLPIHVHPVWKQALAAPRKTPAPPTSVPRTEPRPGGPTTTSRSTPNASADTRKPSAGPADGRGPTSSAGSSTVKSAAAVRVASTAAASFAAKGSSSATATLPSGSRTAAAQVSVDHLDEDLELLDPDELPLAPSKAAAAPVESAAPAKPADAGAKKAKAKTDVAGASLPKLVIKTPTTAKKPASAAPATAENPLAGLPMIVEPVEESTELALPADGDAARAALVTEDVASEVPLDIIPVDEIHDASTAATVSDAAVAPAAIESADAAAEVEVEAATASASAPDAQVEAPADADVATAVSEAAPHEAAAPAPVAPEWTAAAADPTPTPIEDTHEGEAAADAELIELHRSASAPMAALPSAKRSNRTMLYVGGAVAAAAIIAVALMRGREGASTPAAATEIAQRPVNAAIPASPLTPPSAELNEIGAAAADSILALGRIEPPAVATPAPTPPAPVERAPETVAADSKPRTKEPKPAKAAIDTTPEILAAPVDVGALSAAAPLEPAASMAPDLMANRYVAAQNAAWNDLVTRLRLAGFENLFSPARVAPSGASSARAAVAAARAHIAQWRTRSSAIDKAYRDSTAALVSRGVWSAGEMQTFSARANRGESGEGAQRTNAILGAADRLFGILAANNAAYEVGPSGLRFTDSGPQRDYWETRRALMDALGAAGTPAPQTPLVLVLKAVGGSRPPEGVNAS